MESVRRIVSELPQMTVGVGTILTTEQADKVKSSGAAFGVAPGYNSEVVAHAKKLALPFGPGIAVPLEIEGAVSQGCRILKFFHAEGMGGLRYLKGIHAPYAFLGLKYIPLGGITPANMPSYLEMPEILAIGGSWIAPRDLIQTGNWKQIGRNASEAVRILQEVRGLS